MVGHVDYRLRCDDVMKWLQKRQAAQLRRMRRLMGEAQAHRRQWVERASQLRAIISQVKERIEE